MLAFQPPAALAGLEGGEAVAAEAFRPEGDERAVGAAGDGVFVDAVIGGEDSAGDVGAVAWRSDHHQAIVSFQSTEIRIDRADSGLICEQSDRGAIAAASSQSPA